MFCFTLHVCDLIQLHFLKILKNAASAKSFFTFIGQLCALKFCTVTRTVVRMHCCFCSCRYMSLTGCTSGCAHWAPLNMLYRQCLSSVCLCFTFISTLVFEDSVIFSGGAETAHPIPHWPTQNYNFCPRLRCGITPLRAFPAPWLKSLCIVIVLHNGHLCPLQRVEPWHRKC